MDDLCRWVYLCHNKDWFSINGDKLYIRLVCFTNWVFPIPQLFALHFVKWMYLYFSPFELKYFQKHCWKPCILLENFVQAEVNAGNYIFVFVINQEADCQAWMRSMRAGFLHRGCSLGTLYLLKTEEGNISQGKTLLSIT